MNWMQEPFEPMSGSERGISYCTKARFMCHEICNSGPTFCEHTMTLPLQGTQAAGRPWNLSLATTGGQASWDTLPAMSEDATPAIAPSPSQQRRLGNYHQTMCQTADGRSSQ